MKALSIHQPWASLIIAGHKPYEFRSWRAPRAIIGQRIAIHATVRKVHALELRDLISRLTSDQAWTTGLKPEAVQFLRNVLNGISVLPRGSILGTAVLGEPRSGADIAEEMGGKINDSDRHAHSNWGWPMLDVKPLEPFVPARGAQGFWEWRA